MQTAPLQHYAKADARREINTLYTPLPEALEELEQRRKDVALCSRVEAFHQVLFPTFVPLDPVGVFFRAIITPNHEFDRYFECLRATKLLPLFCEFHRDVYVSCNRDKYRLCCQSFAANSAELWGLRAVDLKSLECKPHPRLCDIKTKNGLKLTDYHHALLETAYPGCEKHIVDFSDWFIESRYGELYYLRYLALFICHGILFENFIVEDKSELQFVRERVIPSFVRVTELFDVRPLIVPILPHDSENSDYWRSLPVSLYSRAVELLQSKK